MKENNKFIIGGIVAALVLSHFSLETSAYYIVDTFEAIVTPYGLWMSPDNIMYASSPTSVSKISGSAPTTVIAGGGGVVGDGGPATSAQLFGSYGIKGDSSGNIFICERDNYSIRKVNLASGIISTIAGGSNTGNNGGDNGPATSANLGMSMSIAFDTSGNMFFADFSYGVLRKIDINGIITTFLGDEIFCFLMM